MSMVRVQAVMAKKILFILMALLAVGGVFVVVRQRRKTVKVPDELTHGAKVTPAMTIDMRGSHDPKPAKVDHVELSVPDAPA